MVIIIYGFSILSNKQYQRFLLYDLKPCPFKTHPIFSPQSTCGTGVAVAGIISYALYTDYDSIAINLIDNIRKVKKYLPQWQVRIYSAIDISPQLVQQLCASGAEVIIMGPELPKGHQGEVWKFLPAATSLPFVALSAGDPFSKMDAKNIRQWITSNRRFCCFSNLNWGSRDSAIPNIKSLIDEYSEHWLGFADVFFVRVIYPLLSGKSYRDNFPSIKILFLILIIAILLALYFSFNLYH